MRIGFVGIGKMGKPMAKHILEGGHELWVHDVSRAAAADLLETGARWAATPAEAANGSAIVFMSLPMPKDVEQVCLSKSGIVETIPSGSAIVDLSTNAPSVVRRLHEEFKSRRNAEFVDIGVSGGPRGAASRDMSMLAGGDKATYERIKPVLDLLGDKPVYCGPSGSGIITKLCHNLFAYILQWSMAEVLTLGVKAGVELPVLVEGISKSGMGKNPPFEQWRKGTVITNFDPDPFGFALELAHKDVKLACELASEFMVPLDMGTIAEQRLMEAVNRGWGKKKAAVYRTLQEDRAGVRLAR